MRADGARGHCGRRAELLLVFAAAMAQQPPAELRFERYLAAYGYSWEYEPDLGRRERVDYVIRRGQVTAACEVKEFETTAIRELGDRVGTPVIVPPHLLYRTIRSQVKRAARKLKPLAERAWPLLVVLSNPRGASVMLDPRTVFTSLYGQPGGDYSPGRRAFRLNVWPFPQYAGRGGVLHRYPEISAVATLHPYAGSGVQLWGGGESPSDWDIGGDGVDQERPPFVHVFRGVGTTAVPLPDRMFDGPIDATWALNPEGALEQCRGFVRADAVMDNGE